MPVWRPTSLKCAKPSGPKSEILAGLEADGTIVITGGVYNVATGEVEFTHKPA